MMKLTSLHKEYTMKYLGKIISKNLMLVKSIFLHNVQFPRKKVETLILSDAEKRN